VVIYVLSLTYIVPQLSPNHPMISGFESEQGHAPVFQPENLKKQKEEKIYKLFPRNKHTSISWIVDTLSL
jgi:hypothetical protein